MSVSPSSGKQMFSYSLFFWPWENLRSLSPVPLIFYFVTDVVTGEKSCETGQQSRNSVFTGYFNRDNLKN